MFPLAHQTLKTSGASYFFTGFSLLLKPELRLFLWVPLLLNLILFGLLTSLLAQYFSDGLAALLSAIPGWLHFLAWLLWLLFVVLLLLVYGYSFNILTSIIAAPFYGLLAQKTQEMLGGPPLPDETWAQLVPRTFGREWQKLKYFIPRSLGILLLGLLSLFIPVLNLFLPVMIFVWGAWCMSIQFCDYAADNNHHGFVSLRQQMAAARATSLGFGSLCVMASMVPFLNIIAMPAAVAGGTALWLARGMKSV